METETENLSAYNGCTILDVNVTVPWDSPGNLVSFHSESFFYSFMSAFFIPALYLVGVPANIINMAVFKKQGEIY
jgi:hypothetical protein